MRFCVPSESVTQSIITSDDAMAMLEAIAGLVADHKLEFSNKALLCGVGGVLIELWEVLLSKTGNTMVDGRIPEPGKRVPLIELSESIKNVHRWFQQLKCV